MRRGNKWELYYTASGSSQPTRITDGRFKAAIQVLLDWHKAKLNCNNCVELAPGQWHLCEEAQELLVGGSEENAKDSVIRESPTPSAGFDLAGLLYARDDWSGRGGRSHGWPAWFSLGSHNILLLAWNPKV